ncbi:CpsB/CapC family capsule biosynthesis tyrosine phosphatase [Lentibacillus sp. N15]|uniref:tyrosine-protein phosphatase n=1 Tax=Lentibacillus songyuanensis TaxID=3136161 RepID=UPI0031BA6320
MIDIHCHILPGMDNGPGTMQETLTMVEMAHNQGIHTIIAAPHHRNGSYENEKEAILGAVDYVNAKLREQQLDVLILPGQAIFMYAELVRDLERGLLLPLNETSGYVLLELPTTHVPAFASEVVFAMQIAGYKPVLANPEENKELRANPNVLYELVRQGALTQISAESVTGTAGKKTQKWVLQVLDAGLAHFVASGAYDGQKRRIQLQAAYKAIKKHAGSSVTEQLMANCELLLQGEPIIRDAPTRLSTKRRFF